ncbi:MAG TPA: hypothetical protein VNE40_01885 [Candidatus Dormibacteraeota bacterium]|nr:hypothetical protein [Candidatus Dormibacteraeota bacterium]
MFEKLLSVLPYNPGLLDQFAFYTKRLRREESVRRTGLVFIILAFSIQFFAVISPPQPTVANSVNDLINGGISSATGAIDACKNNTHHYQNILDYYGISCADVAKATTVSIKSTDYRKQLYSMGWIAQGPTNLHTGKSTGETTVNIPAAGKLYWRYLWSWDTNSFSPYTALRLTSSRTHKLFFILYSCGNLVSVGIPAPPPPPPPPPAPPAPPAPKPPQVLSCSNLVMNYAENTTVQIGSPIIVRGQAAGSNIKTGQTVDMYYDYVNASTQQIVASAKSLAVGFSGTTANDNHPHSFTANSSGSYVIRLTVKYDTSKIASGSASGNCVKQFSVLQPCQYNNLIPSSSPECKPCEKSLSSLNTTACLTLSKTASDPTQGWSNADGMTAQPGDTIIYTLSVKNSGKATVKNFVVEENLSDVLDYADIVDLYGGTIDSYNLVTWPADNIQAGQTVNHQIKVQVKNPIPQTPTSVSDGSHFDLIMTNSYGNTININVPGSPIKTAEVQIAALPNTGPGSSLMIAGMVTVLVGYFFARSRLLAREGSIVMHETNNSGGA